MKFRDWFGNEHDLPPGTTYGWRPSAYGLIQKDRKILCVQATFHMRWELPGGGVELHESPVEALEREVFEESGYRVKAMEETPIYSSDGFFCVPDTGEGHCLYCHSLPMVFRATLLDEPQRTTHIDPREVNDIRWIGIDELVNYNLSPLILPALRKL